MPKEIQQGDHLLTRIWKLTGKHKYSAILDLINVGKGMRVSDIAKLLGYDHRENIRFLMFNKLKARMVYRWVLEDEDVIVVKKEDSNG